MAYFFLPVLAAAVGLVSAELPVAKLDGVMRSVIKRSGGSMAALIEVTVDPQGKVLNCVVSQSSGDERMVGRVCSAIERTKFKPAEGPEGQKVHAKVKLAFSVGTERALAWKPDVILKVANFPGRERQAETYVNVIFDEEGAVTYCAKTDRPDADAALVDMACEGLRSFSVEPLVADDGAGVPFLSAVIVRLVEEPSGEGL